MPKRQPQAEIAPAANSGTVERSARRTAPQAIMAAPSNGAPADFPQTKIRFIRNATPCDAARRHGTAHQAAYATPATAATGTSARRAVNFVHFSRSRVYAEVCQTNFVHSSRMQALHTRTSAAFRKQSSSRTSSPFVCYAARQHFEGKNTVQPRAREAGMAGAAAHAAAAPQSAAEGRKGSSHDLSRRLRQHTPAIIRRYGDVLESGVAAGG